MSRFRFAARAAIYARLSAGPALGPPVHSNPPANIAINHILIGDIIAEGPEEKGDAGSWYTANIEIWWQTFSPAAVDAIADAIVGRFDGQPLSGNGRSFTAPLFTGEQISTLPAEAGGPVFGRILSFRFYVQ